LVSGVFCFRGLKECLIPRELAFRLGELDFEWTFIDFDKQIALLDELPFFECDMDELAVDSAANSHRIRSSRRSQSPQVNREVDFARCACDYGCPSPPSSSACPSAPAAASIGVRRLDRRRIGCGHLPGMPIPVTTVDRPSRNK